MNRAAEFTQVNKWLITVAVMAGTFMEIIDTTVVNVALPHIAGSLSAGVDESTWVLTSYLISNAIVMSIAAWMAALFGRKRFLMVCLALFTGSSILCGSATSLREIIFFRVLQGIGGGALRPLSQAILLESFPVEERGMAMAIYGMGAIVAPIVGPLLGGWITDNMSWRWAFYINLPVGVISLLMTAFFIVDPAYIRAQRPVRIDYLGLGLLAVGLGCLQVVLDKGERLDWFSSAFITRMALVSAIALIFLVYRELRTKHPVIDLSLFAERNFASGVTMFFVFGFVLYGSIMLLPLFLQTLMGYNATTAGMALAWGGVSAILIMPVAGRLSSMVDNRFLVGAGILLNVLAVYLMSRFNLHVDFATTSWPRFIQGFGMGMAFVALTTLTVSRVPLEKMGAATSIFSLMRNLGGSLGIAIATTLLSRRTQFHQSRLVEHVTTLSPNFQEWMQRLGQWLPGQGSGWNVWHEPQALGLLYHEVQRQAQMLAFCDDYRLFTLLFLGLLPLLFLVRVGPPAGEAPNGQGSAA